MVFPMSTFAQTPPPCAIRSNFNLIVIEASTSQEIRLTSGQGPFVADTLQMATTKARPRVSDGIKAFEAELSSKFPDYAYFQLVAENGVNLFNSLSGVTMVALNPDILLRVTYLGKDPSTDLHFVDLEINGRFLSRIKLKTDRIFFQGGIPYGKLDLILGISLVWVKPSAEALSVTD